MRLLLKYLICLSLLIKPVWAVENPQSGNAAVTATIPALPDTPVLISPTNNSVISTTAPAFIFNPSLGEVTINHYDLYIDGAKNTSPIGQSLTTIITQSLKSLSEGSHVWFIKAVANNTSERNSTTWAFTIDTTAPLILINQVAEHTTSLSSLDLSPWNREVSFATNQAYPVFTGQGEAQASLTISLAGSTTSDTISTTIGADRNFSVKPNVALPAGRYTVSVTSTDPAGNSTSLPSFYLIIIQPAKSFTVTLPRPLPTLTLPITLPPALTPVTAFPIFPAAPALLSPLIWIIIISYLIHILWLNRLIHWLYLHHHIKIYQYIILYITILLPTLLLGFLAWQLSLLSLGLLFYELKLTRTKDIKIEQM